MSIAPGGEQSLPRLIKSMRPTLDSSLADVFVFATVSAESAQVPQLLSADISADVKMIFKENEAWTVILTRSRAEQLGLQYIFPCRQITLNVHSSLDAVGFLATVTARLAKLEIGVNPVSAYFHDHLFVPDGKEHAAVAELERMAAESVDGIS
jgi:hypothetical protein